MKIIKRSGTEVGFNIEKIIAAVRKANKEVAESERLTEQKIDEISRNVEQICLNMNRTLNVEEIQDLVENQIMNCKSFEVARKYITYRYKLLRLRDGGRHILQNRVDFILHKLSPSLHE